MHWGNWKTVSTPSSSSPGSALAVLLRLLFFFPLSMVWVSHRCERRDSYGDLLLYNSSSSEELLLPDIEITALTLPLSTTCWGWWGHWGDLRAGEARREGADELQVSKLPSLHAGALHLRHICSAARLCAWSVDTPEAQLCVDVSLSLVFAHVPLKAHTDGTNAARLWHTCFYINAFICPTHFYEKTSMCYRSVGVLSLAMHQWLADVRSICPPV